jgi:hypothetical protein
MFDYQGNTRRTIRLLGVGLAVVLLVTASAAPVGANSILGQVNARQIEINGVQTPAHTTLLSSSTLETTDHPAIIHLGSGQTLSLAPHSQAHFDGSVEEGVGVSLRYGAIAYRDGSGEVVQLADAGTFMLQQSGVQQGEPISSGGAGLPMCSLKSGDIATCLDDPEDGSCDWEFIDSIAYSDVDAYLNQGATFLTAEAIDSYFGQPGKSSEGQTLVVYDCRDKKVAAVVVASGGLSTAAIAGIAIGGALGIVVIDDATSDDSSGGSVDPAAVGTQVTPQ